MNAEKRAKKPERYVCIHGHFYQPPRENPWLEAIEAQDSAHPYHDWNERITAECYAPNAAARRLDGERRIVHIGSNYARMSWNFGPTLLSWMETADPETYAAILDADRQSRERFSGHGSAIAQAHGHIILPLANERDRRTQVRWGVADFELRFGRKPEGMWLPETAVSTESLEALAAEGILFTILAPRQALAVRRFGDTEWLDASSGRVDPTRPYLARLPSGRSIALFFYDGPISQGIAFERLLDSGDGFAARLRNAGSPRPSGPELIHVATDGETYGHHHRFGDMALAHALYALERDPHVTLTNYGEMLARHPPTWEARILENTSWSCAHGVERWRSDCGCSSGRPGWNQAWRTPLREGLDELSRTLGAHFEARGGEVFQDPWAARDDAVRLLLDRRRASVEAFLAQHARGERSTESDVLRLRLLEMQRHALFMFTSCGWFFDDISGIETVQVMTYAARAIQLCRESGGPDPEPAWLTHLARARSNTDQGTGADVYAKHVLPLVLDLPKVAAHYAISSLFSEYPGHAPIHCYETESEEHRSLAAGRMKLGTGRVRVRSTLTWEEQTVAFSALHLGDHNVTGGVETTGRREEHAAFHASIERAFHRADIPELVRLIDRHYGARVFTAKHLFRDEQRRLMALLLAEAVEQAETAFRKVYEESAPVMRFLADLDIPVPKALFAAAERALSDEIEVLLESQLRLDTARVLQLVAEAKERHITLDRTPLEHAYRTRLERCAAAFGAAPDDPGALGELERVLALARHLPFEPDLWKAQNALYRVLTSTYRGALLRAPTDPSAAAWCRRVAALAEQVTLRLP